MTIKRPKVGALSNKQGEGLAYCPDCIKFNVKQIMEERIYLPDPLTGKTTIPADADLWRQCHRCGKILPVYNLKKEGRLVSDIPIKQNPFDRAKVAVIPNSRIGKNKRGRDEHDYIQDEDLKKELREGSILLGYSES